MSYSKYISKKQVARILGVSLSSVPRWVKTNKLPEPIPFGPNIIKWDVNEIEKWIEERITEVFLVINQKKINDVNKTQ